MATEDMGHEYESQLLDLSGIARLYGGNFSHSIDNTLNYDDIVSSGLE